MMSFKFLQVIQFDLLILLPNLIAIFINRSYEIFELCGFPLLLFYDFLSHFI